MIPGNFDLYQKALDENWMLIDESDWFRKFQITSDDYDLHRLGISVWITFTDQKTKMEAYTHLVHDCNSITMMTENFDKFINSVKAFYGEYLKDTESKTAE